LHQRFSDADSELLARFKDILLALKDEVVQGFYDVIVANPHLVSLIGGSAARAEREKTLRHFWQRTFNGPHDEQFWAWQALVGVVHIKVGVKNPMMLGMWQWLVSALREQLSVERVGDAQTLRDLLRSVDRLALTAQALTAESYLMNYLETVVRLTGFKPALLQRMFDMEIDSVLTEARKQLGKT
jgi:gamma-glutamyl:cysteine ligase YbdK (ATP-grasp superfamily)